MTGSSKTLTAGKSLIMTGSSETLTAGKSLIMTTLQSAMVQLPHVDPLQLPTHEQLKLAPLGISGEQIPLLAHGLEEQGSKFIE